MIPRLIQTRIDDALRRQAAVALLGPRQVGKTTLALEIGRTRDALYLDLEDRDDRNRLTNPALFLESFEDRLVILDEIHRMPAPRRSGVVVASPTGSRAGGSARITWAPEPVDRSAGYQRSRSL